MDIKKISQIIFMTVTMFGGIFTVYTYWKNSVMKRAEWLYRLFEKFFEHDYYKKIRKIVDYNRQDEMNKLKKSIENDSDDAFVESFVDYLNFFEFIASLWKLGQLPITSITMVFGYYIVRLSDYEFIGKFLVDEGFDNLPELIVEVKKRQTK